jgi:hypothetical protein
MRTFHGEYVWKGAEVQIQAEVAPAEHDVGIMAPYPVGVTLMDDKGDKIDLTQEEYDQIMSDDGLLSAIDSWYHQSED